MKTTIGICAYNVEKYIYQCLKSAMDQTYKDIEIIVIDDGSTDNTGYILDRMKDERVTVIHKENEGHAAGREQIVGMMTGDAVYWLDSDDYLLPNAIENSVQVMEETGADIVKTVLFAKDARYCGEYTREEYMRILLPDKIKSQVIGCLFRKEVYSGVHHRVGFVNEDYYVLPRLLDNANKLVLENSGTYIYREARPGSVTSNGKNSFKGYYPRAMHRADRYERYKNEFPEESREVLKQFTDYACMACLFGDTGNPRVLEVRNLLASLEREIGLSKDIHPYKKWLIREILSNGKMTGAAKRLHTIKQKFRRGK